MDTINQTFRSCFNHNLSRTHAKSQNPKYPFSKKFLFLLFRVFFFPNRLAGHSGSTNTGNAFYLIWYKLIKQIAQITGHVFSTVLHFP